jgi:hypothetical protein
MVDAMAGLFESWFGTDTNAAATSWSARITNAGSGSKGVDNSAWFNAAPEWLQDLIVGKPDYECPVCVRQRSCPAMPEEASLLSQALLALLLVGLTVCAMMLHRRRSFAAAKVPEQDSIWRLGFTEYLAAETTRARLASLGPMDGPGVDLALEGSPKEDPAAPVRKTSAASLRKSSTDMDGTPGPEVDEGLVLLRGLFSGCVRAAFFFFGAVFPVVRFSAFWCCLVVCAFAFSRSWLLAAALPPPSHLFYIHPSIL